MNAILPRPLSTAPSTVVAVWRAQPGALMLLGRAPAPVPKAGSARLASSLGAVGVFRAEFWRLSDSGEHAFLAVVRMPDGVDPVDGAELFLRGARTSDREGRLQIGASSVEAEFGREVAALAGRHAAPLAHFMLDVMRASDGSDMHRPHAVLAAFLAGAARPDGCVELMLQAPDHCLVLQGWGTRPPADFKLLTNGPALRCFPAEPAEFDRPDVAAPATGSALILPGTSAADLEGADRIFLLGANELLSRKIIQAPPLLAEASFGQLTHLLPRLVCSAALHGKLRTALQPQFDGVDTLNTSAQPIRAALDIAVDGGAGGVYLSGWVFDPTRSIAEIVLAAGDLRLRLDQTMVRINRKDVSDAFRADARFPSPASDASGFAASVALAIPSNAKPHLRITANDGNVSFLPLTLRDARAPGMRKALLQSVDLHKPSGLPILEQHLAPFLSRLDPPRRDPATLVVAGPADGRRAIVVPLRTHALPRSVIASLLHEPLAPEESLVFVCGATWSAGDVEVLSRLLALYQLPASILHADAPLTSADAVLEAAAFTTADAFLLLDPAAAGSTVGWRSALFDALGTSAAICPTLLYEDGSIRCAGARDLAFEPRAPFAHATASLAGLPAAYVTGRSRVEVSAGSLACCLLRRQALPALERATRFATDTGQDTAAFLDLRDHGLDPAWIPALEVIVPDTGGADLPILSLADRWLLREYWGDTVCAP